jgi:uncharacterized protein HemX
MDEQQKLLNKINRRTRFTQFLAWLALFFTAVGIAAGYKNWLRIHDKAKAGLQGVTEIRQEIPNFALNSKVNFLEKEINENLKYNKDHLDKAMKELRTIQDSTQHIAETVYVQVEALTKQQQAPVTSQTPTIKDWSLGEAHFLLQTAVQRFEINRDKAGAIAAFKLADTLLLERGAIELLPVRKQISEDIATVNQYAIADVGSLSQEIDTLLQQLKPQVAVAEKASKNIELLPTIKTDTNEAMLSGNAGIEDPKKESLVNRVKKTINKAVMIRKFDKPLLEEMDIDSKQRLYQLFSLRLETLRIMLLQGDNINYHRQIQRIKTLLDNYYDEDQRQIYQKQLDKLDTANLSPDFPDVSGSLRLLEKIMSESKGNDINFNNTPLNKGK